MENCKLSELVIKTFGDVRSATGVKGSWGSKKPITWEFLNIIKFKVYPEANFVVFARKFIEILKTA